MDSQYGTFQKNHLMTQFEDPHTQHPLKLNTINKHKPLAIDWIVFYLKSILNLKNKAS